jgi:hypothetical protein
MGASGWSYVTPYHKDVATSLQELRERVFRDKDYFWVDDFEEDESRPATIDKIWDNWVMRETGTHSILDVDRVLTRTDPPDWENGDDYGTVRPLRADRIRHHFGPRPSPAQFEAAEEELRDEAQMRSAGLYVLLYEPGSDVPTHVGFWGYSGD